jgi:thioredoxin reductase (NADPH)
VSRQGPHLDWSAHRTETPDVSGAFPRLEAGQMEALAARGQTRPTREGEVLYRQGDAECDFFVLRAGRAAIVERVGPDERVVAVHGPGRFLGELSVLTGRPALLTAVVSEPGEVIAVPARELRRLVGEDPALGDLILRAYLIRRSVLIELGAGIRIVGSRHSPATRRLREFAARNRLPHRWIDLEEDAEAEALLQGLGIPPQDTPVAIVHGDRVLRNPSAAELARALGLRAPRVADTAWDLVVVGAGPAGLAAAVYGASEGLATVVTDAVATGGQAGTSPRIENYLGFPFGVSGAELAERAVIQAEKFGASIHVPGEAVELGGGDGVHEIRLGDGTSLVARTAVIATGARYRRLPIDRLEDFEGTGVYYAATQTEAQLCRNDPVAVVGGGNSAGQAALFLARHAAGVRLLVRGDDLAAGMSRYLVVRIEHHPRVEAMLRTEVRELVGEGRLEGLVVEDTRTGEQRTIEARALFVFIGAEPHTRWLQGRLALDEHGFVLTGADAAPAVDREALRRNGCEPLLLETSRPGVFAAGDVRRGSIKRVASAVGEGAMTIRLVHEHLEGVGSRR